MVFKNPARYAILGCLLLFSCAPATRISRILARNPDLAKVSRVDTFDTGGIVRIDTFRVTQTDTFSRNDTTFIRTSDTIRLTAKCRGIRETVFIKCPQGKNQDKDSTKGRKGKIRQEKSVKQPREGFFERLTRYAVNGVLLFAFIIGYAIGGSVNRFLEKLHD